MAHEDPGAACELDPGVNLALAFRGRPGMATLEGPLVDDLARGLLLQGSGHDLAHRREKKRRIGLIDHAVAVRVETICPLVDHDLVERSQEGIRKGELQDGHHADRNCRVADGVPEALACDGGHESAEKVGAQPVAEVAIVLCVGIADAPTERAHGPEVGARLLGPSPVAQAAGRERSKVVDTSTIAHAKVSTVVGERRTVSGTKQHQKGPSRSIRASALWRERSHTAYALQPSIGGTRSTSASAETHNAGTMAIPLRTHEQMSPKLNFSGTGASAKVSSYPEVCRRGVIRPA